MPTSVIGYCSNSGRLVRLLLTNCPPVVGIFVVQDESQPASPFISYIGTMKYERGSQFLILHTIYLIYSTKLVVIDFVQRTWYLLVSLSGENVVSADQYRILHAAQRHSMFRIALWSGYCKIEKFSPMDAAPLKPTMSGPICHLKGHSRRLSLFFSQLNSTNIFHPGAATLPEFS